ncbi:MAG: NAD(P)H-dependent glycerol-3-phosphate dehydrogenase [Porticoccus sp.]|nr:NAD(P)H-dependent glycerol-3-phosphate dehydrogenase [Porticoccus sp.]PCJ90762.1 MAG: NAD(P)H-dependent glycerol-3-phosphate dehydrogenase [Porticoccaceae bacterium]
MAVASKVVVLGGGSFGTAIANMIAANGYDVVLWMRDKENALNCERLHENTRYLPDYSLDSSLKFSSDLEASVVGCDVIFFSVPSKGFRDLAQKVMPLTTPGTIVISTAKGIEAHTFKLMSEILEEELPQARVGVISGPNLAKEIAQKAITATVVASADEALCLRVQELLCSRYFRVYANKDRHGVELAGALKNIYAIAAGMSAAMNMGQNTVSVLITRSLAEMSRFATILGANPMTFLGLSGVGDLFVTCTSPLSRNFQVGYALGEGLTLEEATEKVGQVAEGINTTRTIKAEAEKLGIYMPLVSALYEIMFNNRPVKEVLSALMLAEQSTDVEFTSE